MAEPSGPHPPLKATRQLVREGRAAEAPVLFGHDFRHQVEDVGGVDPVEQAAAWRASAGIWPKPEPTTTFGRTWRPRPGGGGAVATTVARSPLRRSVSSTARLAPASRRGELSSVPKSAAAASLSEAVSAALAQPSSSAVSPLSCIRVTTIGTLIVLQACPLRSGPKVRTEPRSSGATASPSSARVEAARAAHEALHADAAGVGRWR